MNAKIISISLIAAAFIGCSGGGGVETSYGSSKLDGGYKKIHSANKSAILPLGARLYKGSELAAADGPRALARNVGELSFPRGWAGAFAGASIVAGIIDSGVDFSIAPGMDGYYVYKGSGWPDIESRLDGSALVHKNYTAERASGSICGKNVDANGVCTHGREVAAMLQKLLPNAKFVNIVLNNSFLKGDKADVGASVDAAANKGVRFFNRSFGSGLDQTVINPGDFLAAIGYKNALVVSAAGNDLLDGKITSNALPASSPLRSGWIVALGYGDYAGVINGVAQEDVFYVNAPGGKRFYVYPRGNTCKSYGGADCIAAPYTSEINHPVASGGLAKRVDGTSFSSPMVLAAAMSVYAKYPWMSNENLKQTLFSTAYEVQGGTAEERKKYFGAGILNAAAAMHGPARFDRDFIADVSEGLYVFSNNIAGRGDLIKSGPGTLALTGNNSFSQVFNTDGELWLLGRNSARIYNDARLRLKRARVGALENSGDLISEGFNAASLELAPQSRLFVNFGETINVDGTAKLNGSLQIVGLANGYVMQGQKASEDIIRANWLSGQFSEISSASAFLQVSKISQDSRALSVEISTKRPSELPELDAYAAKNYQNLFDYFDYLAAARGYESDAKISMSDEQMRGGQGAEAFASALQNLSAAEAAKMADGLFGAKAGQLAAIAANSVRGIADVLMDENTPLFSGFYLGSKAAGLKRDIYGTLLGAQKDLGAASLRASAALARDNESADIYGLNLGLDFAAGEKLKLQANLGAAAHEGELKTRAVFAALGAKYELLSGGAASGSYALSAEAGGDFMYFKTKQINLAPSVIDGKSFSAKSAYAAAVYEYFANNLSAKLRGGLRVNFDKDYQFNGWLEGAQISGKQRYADALNALFGAQIAYALGQNAALELNISTQIGKHTYNNSASLGLSYRF